jgi:hypothetical protein
MMGQRRDVIPFFRAALWAREEEIRLRTVVQQPVRLEETRRWYTFSVPDYHAFPEFVSKKWRVQYDKTQDLTLVYLPKPRWYLNDLVWLANGAYALNVLVVAILAVAYLACMVGLI